VIKYTIVFSMQCRCNLCRPIIHSVVIN